MILETIIGYASRVKGAIEEGINRYATISKDPKKSEEIKIHPLARGKSLLEYHSELLREKEAGRNLSPYEEQRAIDNVVHTYLSLPLHHDPKKDIGIKRKLNRFQL